jgi:ubiquinone/menaquinone biosynthesis C-methylase UbiE
MPADFAQLGENCIAGLVCAGQTGAGNAEASMDDTLRGQVTRSAADVYDEFFVPALFRQWAPRMADAARLASGQRVLDVACGTGVLAREAARRVAPGGAVTGLDRSEGMLAVAGRQAPEVTWKLGMAEALPFPGSSFDAVVSQFGLMFFEDRTQALREMRRVLRPGGRLAVAVWDALETSPGYAAMAGLLDRLFGARIAGALHAPFALGDTKVLGALFSEAAIADVDIRTQVGTARFPSIKSWVETDVKGWTLADLIDDRQYDLLQREAATALRMFARADGAVEFDAPAHIVTAQRAD